MKLKKIILLSLAAVVLLGAIAGVWLYFSQPKTPSNTWIYTPKDSIATSKFAAAENGCYFLTNSTILHFYDYETKVTVPLCSKVSCEHEDYTCDGYVSGFPGTPLFFINNHIYYVADTENGFLVRRNSTGGDVTSIGIPGKKFVELQQAVSVRHYVPTSEYLYYSGSAENKENVESELEETFFVGRIHLSSGKDEILFEETMDKTAETVQLKAAKDGSCLFFWQRGMNIPSTDPNYSAELKNIPVGLYRWTEETGEITTIYESPREQCENFYFVEGDWAYYNTMYEAEQKKRCDNYRINIETGETEFICENATLNYLGNGYAVHKTDSVEGFRLMDLKTKEFLPMDTASRVSAGIIPNIYDDRFFIFTFSDTIEDSMITTDSTFCMVLHDSLKDGLQEKDLIPVHLYSSSTKPVTDSTDPTKPTDPEVSDNEWHSRPIDLITDHPPIPEEYYTKRVQYLPETVHNPDKLLVLKWVFIMSEMDRNWTEDAVVELNQMLSDRKMPFRVQFVIVMGQQDSAISGGPYNAYDLLASEEAKAALKDADLIFGEMSPEEMQVLLTPITQYVNGDSTYSLQNSVAHRLNWLYTTIKGEIYAIPQTRSGGSISCWAIDKTLFEKAGVTAEDFRHDFWAMDETFAKLYKANGNKPFMNLDNQGFSTRLDITLTPLPSDIVRPAERLYQTIGGCFAIDDTKETPEIINILENIRHLQEAVIRYRDAGYYGKDIYSVHQQFYSNISHEDTFVERDGKILIPICGDRFRSYFGYVNGISATSQNIEEAVQLLHLLAEDNAFRNQFLYGKEGRDHKIEAGKIVPIEDKNGPRYCMGSYYGEGFNGYTILSDKASLEGYQDYLDHVEKISYPIAFNFTGFKTELEEIGRILGKYYTIFFNNEPIYDDNANDEDPKVLEPAMDAARYDSMLQELQDSGADVLQAELQRQLDEWLAANQDWFEQMISGS